MKKTILFIFAFSNIIGIVNAQYYSVVDNVRYRMSGSVAIADSCCSDSGIITVHDSVSFTECPQHLRGVYPVTEVGSYCFNGKNITGVSLPNTLRKLGTACFSSCTELINITLPNSITEIGQGAFSHSGITSINLPNSVVRLPENVFLGCESLESIHAPYIWEIRDKCFYGCTSLIEIDAPSAWVFDGSSEGTFEGCSNLQTVRLGGGVSYKCFYGCANLEYVECNINPYDYCGWGHYIRKYAFRGCTSLKYINIGYCSGAGEAAFSLGGGQNLDTIKVMNTDPSMYGWAYYGSVIDQDIDVSHVVVVVPCNLQQVYENCGQWGRFWNIVEDCSGNQDGIEARIDSNVNIYSIDGRVYISGTGGLDATLYSYDGRRVETIQDGQTTQVLPSGVYIVKVGTLTARKVVVIK